MSVGVVCGLPADTVRHGYTLGDVHGLARHAVHLVGPMGMDYADRYHLAWSAICEHLYTEELPPAPNDLLHVGRSAIWKSVDDDRHHHGFYRAHTDGSVHGAASSPAFLGFWWDFTHRHGSCEPGVVERVAVAQILARLREDRREAIVALAVCEDYPAAAAMLGLSYRQFVTLIASARVEFRVLWHEGETPSGMWGVDRRTGRSATALAALRRRAARRARAAASG
jgi:hypothetical protein